MGKKRKLAVAAFAVLAVLALVAVPASRVAAGGGGAQGEEQEEGQDVRQDAGGGKAPEAGGAAAADDTAGAGPSPVSTGATSLSREKVAGSSNIDSCGQRAWDSFDRAVTSMLFLEGADPDEARVSVSDVTASAEGPGGEPAAVRYVCIDGTWHVFEFSADGTCSHRELADKVAGVNATADEARDDLPTDGVGEI